MSLPDTQKSADSRNIYINQVGIKSIKHPLIYVNKAGNKCPSVGIWQMTADLQPEVKGTHMSRFIEILNEKTPEFNIDNFSQITQHVLQKLQTTNAQVSVVFTLFLLKTAPVSKVKSLLDYEVALTSKAVEGKSITSIKVVIPITSLCPCSKNISEYGAHNQRSHVTINAQVEPGVSFEDIITAVEANASCDLYAVLKREDEKFVTERAYDNPAFVEDLVRDLALFLNQHNGIISYSLEAENFESIHNHSAYALITKP